VIFSRYTSFLERENDQLKQRIESLEQRNQELVLALANRPGGSGLLPPKVEKKHTITKSSDHASCSSGWIAHSGDPAILQQEIASHYRKNTSQVSRRSWPQIKSMAEANSQGEPDAG
jgi:hypothetical protein